MRLTSGVVLVLAVVVGLRGDAQQRDQGVEHERQSLERIRALSHRLRVRDDADLARYRQEDHERLTTLFRAEIDRYIETAVGTNETSEQVQARLRRLLADQMPNPEYSGPPIARVSHLRAGRSLLIAYTIKRGPHNDLPTIRGYRSDGSGLKLVATSGRDLDDYYMFTRELPSPIAGELWVLAWGQHHTFNGTKVRFRLVAFDGDELRSVWNPEDMFDAVIQFSESGFRIDHVIRDANTQQWVKAHDEYALNIAGPIRSMLK